MEVHINEEFITNDNLDNIVDDFIENKKRLYIQSPMGTGKTIIVKEILKKHKKVLIITNRVSLAQEFKERYKKYNIQFYKENFNKENSLIIQYDSLNKIDINNYDIFILDEFMSLLFHSLSLLTPKALFNLAKLCLILETKKIVALDAFLGVIDLNDSIKIINDYRENIDFIFYKNKNFFIKTLLESNEKISVSCSSLLTAKAIFSFLKGKKKPFLFSSETPDECKIKALNEVKNQSSKYDVFIYTPSITTGIDILSDFTEHFHLDESGSCDIISSLQMLKRNRKAKKIHCFVKNSISFKETNPEKLNEKVKNDLNEGKIKNPFLVEIDYTTGNYNISLVGRFYNKILALKNLLENNRQKEFLKLIKYQFKNIQFQNKIFDKDLLNDDLKTIINIKNKEISQAVNNEVNDLSLNNLSNKAFQKRVKLENYITDFFGSSLPPEKLEFFLLNPKEFKYARNRELYKRGLNELKSFKKKQIEVFDFNTKEIDILIEFKKKDFILKEMFIKSKLSINEQKLLKILGYKLKSGKLILNTF